MDPKLETLRDAPLVDPLKPFLPEGRRPARRSTKAIYEGEFAPKKLTQKELRQRAEDAHSAKIVAILDYYATTTVPVERIPDHVGLTIEQAALAMERRGRTC